MHLHHRRRQPGRRIALTSSRRAPGRGGPIRDTSPLCTAGTRSYKGREGVNEMKRAIAMLTALCALTACGGRDNACLPKGEKATVLRTGEAEGYRFVTMRRSNGEEVTCTGKNTPLVMSPGDVVDGWTLDKADAAKGR